MCMKTAFLMANRVLKKEKQMTLFPVGSYLQLSGCESTSHVLQYVAIINGSGTPYDSMADLVTDGTLRRPRGCLLAGHTHYTRKHCYVLLPLQTRWPNTFVRSSPVQISLICSLGIWQILHNAQSFFLSFFLVLSAVDILWLYSSCEWSLVSSNCFERAKIRSAKHIPQHVFTAKRKQNSSSMKYNLKAWHTDECISILSYPQDWKPWLTFLNNVDFSEELF